MKRNVVRLTLGLAAMAVCARRLGIASRCFRSPQLRSATVACEVTCSVAAIVSVNGSHGSCEAEQPVLCREAEAAAKRAAAKAQLRQRLRLRQEAATAVATAVVTAVTTAATAVAIAAAIAAAAAIPVVVANGGGEAAAEHDRSCSCRSCRSGPAKQPRRRKEVTIGAKPMAR